MSIFTKQSDNLIETLKKESELEKFFKETFKVDGNVKVLSNALKINFKIACIIELNDSKRGKFFIANLEKRN